MTKYIEKFIFLVILYFICFFLVRIIIGSNKIYQQKFDPVKLATLYNSSQFASDPTNRQFIIEDEDLYAYSGWYFLKTGNLDKINIEHPPLGKYLIGASISIFNNQNIGQIIWGFIFLVLLFYISKIILKNNILALLVILFIILEPLFTDQITHSLLDLPLAVFISIFILLILSNKYLKNYLWTGIVLGIISGIKYPSIAAIVFLTLVVYLLIKKEKNIIKYLLSISAIASVVFLLPYLPFFIKHPSIIDFYYLQLKALKIHLSHVPEYPKLQAINVLMFDRWLSWWGNKDFVKTGFWTPFWPILTLNSILSLLYFKKNLLINIWTFLYLIFISSRLFFPRYLFLILPFFYIQLCYNFKEIIRLKEYKNR